MGIMIALVLPDTGPLISLARIDRLDLFDRFQCPTLITDAVHFELMVATPRAPEHMALSLWMTSHGNQLRVVKTTYGSLMKTNRKLLQSVPDSQRLQLQREIRGRNAGELAIQELVNTLRPELSREAQALVLFEDQRVRTMPLGPHARIMSSWSFAMALESLGVIPSAKGLFDEIEETGRYRPKNSLMQVTIPISRTGQFRPVQPHPSSGPDMTATPQLSRRSPVLVRIRQSQMAMAGFPFMWLRITHRQKR